MTDDNDEHKTDKATTMIVLIKTTTMKTITFTKTNRAMKQPMPMVTPSRLPNIFSYYTVVLLYIILQHY